MRQSASLREPAFATEHELPLFVPDYQDGGYGEFIFGVRRRQITANGATSAKESRLARSHVRPWHGSTFLITYPGMLKTFTHACGSVLSLLAAVLAAPALAADAAPTSFDPLQAVRVGTPGKTDAGQARQERDRLVEQAKAPLDEAQARLGLANWLLAVAPAESATRWLLGMQDADDLRTIARAGREAADQIARARKLLEASGEDQDGKRQQGLNEAAGTLEAFAAIFERAESGAQTEAEQEAWRKAGRQLATARESKQAPVAAAALLWQAFSFNLAGRRERALEALPDALAAAEHLPYSLMSRLLRCRMIAEDGRQAAATVLLGEMQEQLKTWMTNQNQERNNARRLVGALQYRILTDWMKKLETATQPASADRAKMLEPLLESIRRGFSEVKEPGVYYMETAIPLGIAPEMESKPAEEKSTGPADTPATAPGN